MCGNVPVTGSVDWTGMSDVGLEVDSAASDVCVMFVTWSWTDCV